MNSKSKTGSSSVKEKNAPRGVLFRINAKVKVVISIRTNATSVRLALDSKPEFADPAVGKMKYGLWIEYVHANQVIKEWMVSVPHHVDNTNPIKEVSVSVILDMPDIKVSANCVLQALPPTPIKQTVFVHKILPIMMAKIMCVLPVPQDPSQMLIEMAANVSSSTLMILLENANPIALKMKNILNPPKIANASLVMKEWMESVWANVRKINSIKSIHVSAMLDTSDIMVLVDCALKTPSQMLSKLTVSANRALTTMGQMKINVSPALKILLLWVMAANVIRVTNSIMEDVSQSVILTQFGNQVNVSVLPNIPFMEELVENAQLIPLPTRIKHPVFVLWLLTYIILMQIHAQFAQPIQSPMQREQDATVSHSMWKLMEFVPLTVAAIKSIHPHLQHVNVRKVISLIVVRVSQSVIPTQFGNQVNVFVLPNILFMEVLADNAQLIQCPTKIRHPASAMNLLMSTMPMPTNARSVLQNQTQMQIGLAVIALHSINMLMKSAPPAVELMSSTLMPTSNASVHLDL